MEKLKCDQCGRKITKYYRIYGHILCSKHMHQIYKFGKFLDSNPRTNNDLNDYVIKDNIAIFNLYNQKNEKVAEFTINKRDISKIKYNKWRLSHQHVVTGSGTKNIKDVSWYILDCFDSIKKGLVVDHINGNPLDNRSENLRVCTQGNNTINKSFISNNTSGFIGVSFDKKRNKWCAEIRINNKRIHFKRKDNLNEAVLQRYYAEKILFEEFKNQKEHQKKKEFLSNNRLESSVIEEIKHEVTEKVHKLCRNARC